MKKIYILFLYLIIGSIVIAQKKGTFTDVRDGKVYKTVEIGSQVWMAENLAFKMETGCLAYNYDDTNIPNYGYLYKWKSAKKSCPVGWHLPTYEEFQKLTSQLEGINVAGAYLKSEQLWKAPNTGANNESGFNAVPGGYLGVDNNFYELGLSSYYWTISLSNSDEHAWYMHIKSNSMSVYRTYGDITYGHSVRCVKD